MMGPSQQALVAQTVKKLKGDPRVKSGLAPEGKAPPPSPLTPSAGSSHQRIRVPGLTNPGY